MDSATVAGMPVIGVNTTIREEDLSQYKPDLMRLDISHITLMDITSLGRGSLVLVVPDTATK